MAHNVTFRVPNRKLGREDIRFDVYDEERKIGTLLVSKGAIAWRPGHAKKLYTARWETFDNLMKTLKGRYTPREGE